MASSAIANPLVRNLAPTVDERTTAMAPHAKPTVADLICHLIPTVEERRAVMASPTSIISIEVVERLSRELDSMIQESETTHEAIDVHLLWIRYVVLGLLLADIVHENAIRSEKILWDVTCRISNKYKKALGKFKGENQHRFAVQKNKLEKRYTIFVKSSQAFYKGFIQLFEAHFPAVSNLQKIVTKLNVGHLPPAEGNVQVTPEIEQAVTHCVYWMLLHLGDLSRYRNEARATEDKIWEHARAYYKLAIRVIPSKGAAYNLMACLALQDHNPLDQVYHLYRALAAAEKPYPKAQGNLETAFKKLIGAWNDGAVTMSAYSSPEAVAIKWLLILHAMLYKGGDFPRHDEIENEFIHQTATLLKDVSMKQEVLAKIALINIAAEYCALERLKGDPASPSYKKSYFGLLRLNVRTFFMLLQVLQPEFCADELEVLPGMRKPEKITHLMKHILPILRHYSTWFVAMAEALTGVTFGEVNSSQGNADILLIDNLKIHAKELFRLYASTLCLFCAAFNSQTILKYPQVEYLLQEDVLALGFKPFSDEGWAPYGGVVYYISEGVVKPQVTDLGVKKENEEAEMMTRIKDFVRDGAIIATHMSETPIEIAKGKEGVFYFQEDLLPNILPLNGHSPGHSMTSLEMKRTLSERDQERGYGLGGTILPDTEFTHESAAQRLNYMVTELVDNREESYGMNTGTANELFSGQLAENFLQSSHEVPGYPHADFALYGNTMLNTESQSLYTNQQFETLGRMTFGHRNQVPQPVQPSNNVPNQGMTKQKRRPEGIIGSELTPSEMEVHLKMFSAPFSSWANKSGIDASTPKANPLQLQVTQTASPSYPAYTPTVGNYLQTSSMTGALFESSGHGMYGDSNSYEREMLLQSSFPSLIGQMQMQTPPGGQG